MPQYRLITGDALATKLPSQSVDLVFGSPPYESQRTYGMGFDLRGDAWVDWMAQGFQEWSRVCRGLVAMVVEGFTDDYQWSATPALLLAKLHRQGLNLRKPPIFHRVGIPGSGGPDWLRNDFEFIVCTTPPGKLPWSDNTAAGHPPKFEPGGQISHRTKDGTRHNMTHDQPGGYTPPAMANPGNVIHCKVGGGLMGHDLAHANVAPFPLKLADFFVRSFCPPGGVVLDPFVGSGTTIDAAYRAGRNAIGIDKRYSQICLSTRRMRSVVEAVAAAEPAKTKGAA
jgi:hypothetical protein